MAAAAEWQERVKRLFTGPDADALADAARRRFARVKLTRPDATRKGSAELYLVCVGHRPA